MNDKEYGFRSSVFTADILSIITHRITEELDNKKYLKSDRTISKTFEKVWHWRHLQKLVSYGTSRRVLAFIMSVLSFCNGRR